MKITAYLLDRLLYEDESTTLDFKRDQYAFEGASNEQKSELLKDILAFANAWRRADAYILIGIDHQLGSKSHVCGVADHLDDAKLQQFVSSKTQRAVEFSYQTLEYEGKPVGVIHIPCQARPLYLHNDYRKLKKNVVYVRRGSSTAEADPEETFKMRAEPPPADTRPALTVELGDDEEKTLLDREVRLQTINWEYDEADIPARNNESRIMVVMHNRHYYRELVAYRQATDAVKGFSFAVTNAAGVPALGVVLDIEFDDPGKELTVHTEDDLPSVPRSTFLDLTSDHLHLRAIDRRVQVQRTTAKHLVSVDIGKVRPKSTVWSSARLCLGATRSQLVVAACIVRADNLPEPMRTDLRFQIDTETQQMNIGEVVLRGIQAANDDGEV